jgi:hypothetical protein
MGNETGHKVGRVAFEAPAVETFLVAHRELEKLVLIARQQRIKDLVARAWRARFEPIRSRTAARRPATIRCASRLRGARSRADTLYKSQAGKLP